MQQRKTKQLAILAATLVVSVLAISCGGGGDDPTDPGGGTLTALFTGATPGDVGMGAGDSSGADFEVEITVDGINDFAGAAFHILFDHSSASLVGWSGTDSILGASGVYNAALVAPGEVAVSAVLPTNAAGLADGTGPLISVSFLATAATTANAFSFKPGASRNMKICPTAGQACTDFVPPSWTGGTLVVTE